MHDRHMEGINEEEEFVMLYVFPFVEDQDEAIWAISDVRQIDKFIDWALEIRKDFTDNHNKYLDGEFDDITEDE